MAKRSDLVIALITAEAAGDFDSARQLREDLRKHDDEEKTVIVIDYERGVTHKRTRVYKNHKLVEEHLDD